MKSILASLAILFTTVVFAQNCVTDEQLVRSLEKLNELQKEYSDKSKEYLETLRQRSSALDAFQACRKRNSELDNIFSALTLQGDPCSKEINEYNALNEKASNQKDMLDTLTLIIKTLALNLKNSQLLRCKRAE